MAAGTNASASVRFIGRGVSLIYFASENAGKAGIRIDGINYPPVDMYSPATMQYGKTEQVIATDLPPSEHVLTITMSGEKNPLSSGIGIVFSNGMSYR